VISAIESNRIESVIDAKKSPASKNTTKLESVLPHWRAVHMAGLAVFATVRWSGNRRPFN
jgi:hypothetical protein